jgi:hypothetical protein
MAQGNHAPPYGRAGARGMWLFLLLAGLLAGCSRPADEQALRDTLVAMQRAVEQREPAAVVEHVADNFAGAGSMDREALRRMLVVQFMRNQQVGVTLGPVSVRIEGERAEAEFRALLTGFDQGLLPVRADGYRIVTGWRVEGGRWVLERASWE